MTVDAPEAPASAPLPRRSRPRRVLDFLRNTWRGLTSMRTALVLLFLLALAALPGALLPQWSLNAQRVTDYIVAHGWWGRLLNQLQFFEVYGSVWFAAIYLLLFVSLVGCLTPRTFEYAKALRAKPVLTPRNLGRLPLNRESTVDTPVDEVIASARTRLRGWRTVEREEDDGSRTISAEKGYLREAGNLAFHFAMLGLIVALAVGKLFNYEGQVIVLANGSQFCNSGVVGYDSFEPGLTVDGTDLTPFCLQVNGFQVTYLPSGQPEHFRVDMRYQSEGDLTAGTWRDYPLESNSPLRTAGDRVYLMGNGYAPRFTVRYPDGTERVGLIQWRPVDPSTFLSEGAVKFDPPGVTDPVQRRTKQLAVTGLFAPTAGFDGKVLTSRFPDLLDPAVAVDVLRGDLGNDSGRGQSIFSVDQSMVDSGRLKKIARENLRLGQHLTLDDGTRITFDGVERFVSLKVAHDPAQDWVLVFAVALVLGLGVSLTIKRRRFWVRATRITRDQGPDRTLIQVGGLARTDQAGYGEEFGRLADDVLRTSGRDT
ncbi:cytochrome c biogenesis protein [Herbihabitans rhizosphaerae]|uniref:Cytochrome c biogenesis protein n=1 Tax=Herbihabitans rhizosphaerae TaxID=1872711 RepID=A0A4V2EUH0_9PSEU|nr:cytochrome c biogenesis protein ResB [Herbihabitans rhizosphaerae]RZS44543.1 cytochrome c biogenesis protein [Herbihabitans rhizosphaerae]